VEALWEPAQELAMLARPAPSVPLSELELEVEEAAAALVPEAHWRNGHIPLLSLTASLQRLFELPVSPQLSGEKP